MLAVRWHTRVERCSICANASRLLQNPMLHIPRPALLSALVALACSGHTAPDNGGGTDNERGQPALDCPLTGVGQPCTCPGSSVCPGTGDIWYKCLDSGVWDKTDLSCTLGLHCRTSADCMSGQACCGDAYTGSWGTQIISSSCQPTSCSPYSVQLCNSSAECVQPGFTCGAQDQAYGGGSVSHCQEPSD